MRHPPARRGARKMFLQGAGVNIIASLSNGTLGYGV